MDENSPSEQLEEGEIIDDDDDFEDISDNSIIDSAFGKFVSSNENLRALSLSSDSEIERTRYKRKFYHRKSRVKTQKRRKRVRVSSDSSDSDDISPPHHLKGKLKEAIRISGIEDSHRNTLETRLKAMGGLAVSCEPVPAEPESAIGIPKESDKENVDKLDDAELENLRMEALKTAVLNKCQRRKRKKAQLENQEVGAPLENKENDTPKDDKNDDEQKPETVVDMEEDEDLLRASLLANLAQKITKKQIPNENVQKQLGPKLPNAVPVLPKQPINQFKNNIMNKPIISNKIINKISRLKPLVKPLIIQVNDDSDSDEESKPKTVNLLQLKPTPQVRQKVAETSAKVIQKLPEQQTRIPDLKAITSNVEKFLKEQRAKFETETKNNEKTILEKSAVKLLPKSQQIEYQQLLKKLRNAERKRKAKKLALENAKTQTIVKHPIIDTLGLEKVAGSAPPEKKTPTDESLKSDSSTQEKSKASDTSDGRRLAITSELTTLQKTLKEIKMQRNGSLQIKSKYQVLTPIIRKITETSNERKKQENRIKTLMEELNEARNNLTKSHERFSSLVKELVSKKEKIDKSCEESKIVKENDKVSNENKEVENKKKDVRGLPVTSTPIKTENDVTEVAPFVTNNDYEDMDVCNSDDEIDCQIDIVDPNDIDQIFKKKVPMKSVVPEYISPLSRNVYDRYPHVDPLGIMCPYEVNGSCRDIDCTYKHYLKTQRL